MTYRARNIGLALALGLGAALLVTLYVKKSGSSSSSLGKQLVSVFVASHDISPGTPASDLGGAVHPEQVRGPAVPGAISDLSQVRGQVTTDTIYDGQQVSARQFQPKVALGLRGQIARTYRAVSVPGDANQLLVGIVKNGDRVDLLANVKYRLVNFRSASGSASTDTNDLVATRIVLRNIKVLQAPAAAAGSSKFSGNSDWAAVLAVTDNQAQKLFYVLKNNDWSLELRPIHGSADSPDSVETTGSILGDGLRGPQFQELILGPRGPAR